MDDGWKGFCTGNLCIVEESFQQTYGCPSLCFFHRECTTMKNRKRDAATPITSMAHAILDDLWRLNAFVHPCPQDFLPQHESVHANPWILWVVDEQHFTAGRMRRMGRMGRKWRQSWHESTPLISQTTYLAPSPAQPLNLSPNTIYIIPLPNFRAKRDQLTTCVDCEECLDVYKADGPSILTDLLR